MIMYVCIITSDLYIKILGKKILKGKERRVFHGAKVAHHVLHHDVRLTSHYEVMVECNNNNTITRSTAEKQAN